MTSAAFNASLAKAMPPAGLSPGTRRIVVGRQGRVGQGACFGMSEDGPECAWVHAYLHRVEGDLDNARYWYRQARRPPATGELADEWAAIAAALLERGSVSG